jgi:uncharacterized protein (TIGR02466 family)
MKIDHIFPIPIMTITVDPRITDNSLTLVNQYIESKKLLDTDKPHNELLTTFYNNKDFLGNIQDKELLDLINIKSREFLHLKGFLSNSYLEITSWLQLYPSNTHFNKHDHYGAILSGVFYLEAPEKCGNIRFYSPITGRRATDVFFDRIKRINNEYNYSYVEYKPIKGQMLLFEPWLEHSVDKNLSDKNRISISFNIWADEAELWKGKDAKN